ncbi:MAG: sigma-70 family RNA polymerase sigma factor [Saprospiraceae bacterium]
MENPSSTVISKCLKGDRKAQKMLFQTYASALLTVARQYTPVNEDPLDTLQDSFIKIFDKLHTFDEGKGLFISWCRRIVINTALKKLSKQTIFEVIPINEVTESFDEYAITDMEDIEHILKLIEKLPDGYKQVFCLYEIEGYNHKEIAEMLEIKEATSRSQLSKSKNLLKLWLKSVDSYLLYNIQ